MSPLILITGFCQWAYWDTSRVFSNQLLPPSTTFFDVIKRDKVTVICHLQFFPQAFQSAHCELKAEDLVYTPLENCRWSADP